MTLQARLSLIIISTFVTLWAITSYFSISKLERDIERSMDNRLQATAAMMQNILSSTNEDKITTTVSIPVLVNNAGTSKGLACKVSSLSGEVIANSHPEAFKDVQIIAPGFGFVEEQGIKWRTYTSKTNKHTITIADKVSERAELYYQVALTTALPSAFGLIVSLVFVWVAVRRSLKPLETFSNTLKRRNIKDLSPVQIDSPLKELKPLVDSQNALLLRLKNAVEREKSFTDNAAHELRTPLTGIISQLQVAKITDGDTHIKALTQCEISSQRMKTLIDDLLLLSRIESTEALHTDGMWQPAQEIDTLLSDMDIAYNRVDTTCYVDLPINWAPSFTLHIICRNLLDNALRHGEKGNIKLHVTSDEQGLSVSVTNSGKVDENKLDSLSRRFWRDSAKEGSGLGLAIVDALAKNFDGYVSFKNSPGNYFNVIVQLNKPLNNIIP